MTMRWRHLLKRMLSFAAIALIATVAAILAGDANANGLKRLYVLDCGEGPVALDTKCQCGQPCNTT
jgi:hypothetical protein